MTAAPQFAPTIRFHDLTLGYGTRPAVHHLEGEVSAGSLLAVVGPNGSGKSTLLKGIVGELRPLHGRIEVSDLAAGDIAYLPQQAAIERSFPITVFELAALGLWATVGAVRGLRHTERERVDSALAAVGLAGFGQRFIDTLSGGQLQRALFARVLVQNSRLILLDEPFTAIDAKTSADLMTLIERWHGERRTVIAVLHDLDLVKERFPTAIMLARVVVAFGQTRDVLSAANQLRARAMVERWDDSAVWCDRGAAR